MKRVDLHFLEDLRVFVDIFVLFESRSLAFRSVDDRRRARVLRPAITAGELSGCSPRRTQTGKRVLFVDLNNFAAFPTLSVGLIVSALRNNGHQVRLLCPLSYDVPAAEHERNETFWNNIQRRVHLSTSPALRKLRDLAYAVSTWRAERPHGTVIREVRKALAAKPEVLLLSAYLMHFNSVREIASLAKQAGVPVLLGGPMFNLPDTAEAWRQIDGISAVVGAESDASIGDLVTAVVEGGDLLRFSGVVLPNGTRNGVAGPLRKLDEVPVPDFSDFPWDRYPVRVVPLMTGRGCQWDKCLFCSDVISTSGRTFRTRSLDTVLLEMQEQARRYETKNFIFLDLKLNSYPDMFRGIAENIQGYVRGAEWIGTVHVDLRADNGLSRKDLFAAVKGGMRRISFGFESGSQSLLDRMQKGSSVERNSQFIRDAFDAGLSIRCSMFRGFPGETEEDMEATVRFLEAHETYLDRVRFVDFKLCEGTPIHKAVLEKNPIVGSLRAGEADPRRARMAFSGREHRDRGYRKQVSLAMSIVHRINSRQLRNSARQFDGMM